MDVWQSVCCKVGCCPQRRGGYPATPQQFQSEISGVNHRPGLSCATALHQTQTLGVDSQITRGPLTAILPLDMATESIDDMFDGCRSEAASMIDLFGVFEWHFNRNFSYAWAVAERNAKKPAHRQLKDDHAVALHMYTQVKFIQQEFNKAVQTGKHEYNTYGFRFHYLYFYLTDAVKVLRQNSTSCRTTYHRTKMHFNHNVINTNMRFGAFTWASLSKFGDESGFEIVLCHGADVSLFLKLGEAEREALIPPYEVFKVISVKRRSEQKNLPCEVVYKLKSTGKTLSSLNCLGGKTIIITI
uniref:NAD(P)(+)--arginine ADP-ribosyltransferase n=1 Tax=Labrus bergylta TaxID=56723 RepID=A0A3Q3M7W2_9LABR